MGKRLRRDEAQLATGAIKSVLEGGEFWEGGGKFMCESRGFNGRRGCRTANRGGRTGFGPAEGMGLGWGWGWF